MSNKGTTVDYSRWLACRPFPSRDLLPADIFKGDRQTVLTTLALLMLKPEPERNASFDIEAALLASYAAGARVTPTAHELGVLAVDPRAFCRATASPALSGFATASCLSFILQATRERRLLERPCLGSASDRLLQLKMLWLDSSLVSPAFCPRPGDCCREELITIAFLSLIPGSLSIRATDLATGILALWAAGARVSISADLYRQLSSELEKSQKSAASRRARMAACVLESAGKRAAADGLL